VSFNPLSEPYHGCEAAVRLHRLTFTAYLNFEANCPPELQEHYRAVEGFIFDEMRAALRAELTDEDTYHLCAFAAHLLKLRPGIIAEFDEPETESPGA